MIAATGDPLLVTSATSLIPIGERDQEDQPQHCCGHHGCHDCARDAAVRVFGLFGEVRGRVEADQRGQADDHSGHEPAADGEVIDRIGGHATRGQVLDVARAREHHHDRQSDHQHDDDGQLDSDCAGCDQPEQTGGGDHEHGLDDHDHDRDHSRSALVVLHAQQRHQRLARQGVVHRDHADREIPEAQPAEQPAHLRVGQPRRPLIGGAAERDPRGELSDHQGDQCLPDRRRYPQPDPHRTGSQEHLVVRREDPDCHRDERERDREHLERSESSLQLRLVAARRHRWSQVFCCHRAVRSSADDAGPLDSGANDFDP